MRRPIVLLHGYSSNAAALAEWHRILGERGFDPKDIRLGEYVSLSNEITIKDIAEGFDRALKAEGGLDPDQEFDAIVHSTGGLVIREWLVTYATRRERLKHLIGLAPAMFGSPMAHRGRGPLGAIFKGRKDILAPDFMEAGDRVLSGLELASAYTWNLAHRDLLPPSAAGDQVIDAEPIYGENDDTPFPFVFIGLEGYGFLQELVVREDGYDGTVRWAGAALNTRKLVIDLTREAQVSPERVQAPPRRSIDIPLVLIPDRNHSTILKDPPDDLVDMVLEALDVGSMDAYRAWGDKWSSLTPERLADLGKDHWQQFVVRVVDERGDPVPDYYIELGLGSEFEPLRHFGWDVHPYKDDPSFRCYHVNLTKLIEQHKDKTRRLRLRLTASSGTDLVAYHGVGSQTFTAEGEPLEGDRNVWDAQLDITPPPGVRFFFPYTTTLVEIHVNREPMPPTGATRLTKFV